MTVRQHVHKRRRVLGLTVGRCSFRRLTRRAGRPRSIGAGRFLEGHQLAFAWFGGVFEEVRHDNLGSAVKKVLRGRRRVETGRFIAMRSHHLFDSIFAVSSETRCGTRLGT